MKRTMAALGFLAASLCVAAATQAQTVQTQVAAGGGKATVEQLTEATATVTAIDAKYREVTLKGEKGNTVIIECGPEVKNFDQIKVGDKVKVQYYESLTLKLDKTEGAAPGQSEASAEMRAQPGEKPGAVKAQEVTLVGKITAIDAATSMVTVVGPKGRSIDLEVEPDTLAKVKVGDLVSATYTQALAVSVSPAGN